MKQYHKHLKAILKKGVYKKPSREGMPGSISLFGYQNRYNLQEGFPIVTTKKINFKNIVLELLWFLKGDSNIKYLIDNNCNIWNEDAYQYFLKNCEKANWVKWSFEKFISEIKNNNLKDLPIYDDYILGDTGEQYPKLWREWKSHTSFVYDDQDLLNNGYYKTIPIDQIKSLIEGLKNKPFSRRHIITAWNPATLEDMALPACHTMFQLNCRKLTFKERLNLWGLGEYKDIDEPYGSEKHGNKEMDKIKVPKYYLDCQLYQRSADMFLGVPYNIASYSLLIHIIAKICNMIPGDFVHTFGDSHIYDNHLDQVKEQLARDTEKYDLPELLMKDEFYYMTDEELMGKLSIEEIINKLEPDFFILKSYKSYPTIKGKLSTGLK